MSVCDLCSLYINEEDIVRIYSADKEETVFDGTFAQAQDSDFADCEIGSFGAESGVVVINI